MTELKVEAAERIRAAKAGLLEKGRTSESAFGNGENVRLTIGERGAGASCVTRLSQHSGTPSWQLQRLSCQCSGQRDGRGQQNGRASSNGSTKRN